MTELTANEIKQTIKTEVETLGFLLSGFTSPAQLDLSEYENWLAAGYHADMAYLARPSALAKRQDPRLLMPETKTILVLGIPYPVPAPDGVYANRIAAYAQGPDYHDLIPQKLGGFSAWLENLVEEPVNIKIFTDSAPILEKALAVRAGLGWIGKNGLLINPQIGSFFFLAEIFMDLELPADSPFEKDLCGKCQQCLELCPTHSILPGRQIDSRRCLSYLTIEEKGQFTAEELALIQDTCFGCDICQTVCPWNQKRLQQDSLASLFSQNPVLSCLPLQEMLFINEDLFQKRYQRTPIARTKRTGLIRNVLAIIANTGTITDIPVIEKFLETEKNENLRQIAIQAQVQLEQRFAGKES